MKAAIFTEYGEPEWVHIAEVEKPKPKDNEVLIKILATSVNSADVRMRSLNVPHGFELIMKLYLGYSAPKRQILGVECAGVIEAIGKNVTKFKVGDEVFCNDLFNCHAEYKCLAEDKAIAKKPNNLSFEQAAVLSFGGVVALGFLVDKAKIKAGDKLLINGASSTTGLACVQIAKNAGAHISAVCSAKNSDLVKSLGANVVIDYKQQDFTQNGQKYDIIIDCIGNAPYAISKNSLAQNGKLIQLLATLGQTLGALFNKNIITDMPKITHKTLQRLADLAEQEKFIPIIDKIFEFEDIAQAHKYVDDGHKVGSVVIKIAD